jgi:hypothetical protein
LIPHLVLNYNTSTTVAIDSGSSLQDYKMNITDKRVKLWHY